MAAISASTLKRKPAASGSILTESRFFWPSMPTVTIPPPAVASTLICAISCCIFSCMRCMDADMFGGDTNILRCLLRGVANFLAGAIHGGLDCPVAYLRVNELAAD